jgi:hypothetical protein
MARAGHNPFDKGPAEGSRDIVEGELTRHQRADNEVDHLHGVKVSGQPQRGAVNRACDGKKAKE